MCYKMNYPVPPFQIEEIKKRYPEKYRADSLNTVFQTLRKRGGGGVGGGRDDAD